MTDPGVSSFIPAGVPTSVMHTLQPSSSGRVVTLANPQRNEVDSWIDDLVPGKSSHAPDLTSGVGPHTLMAWMVQQYLPKV